jgi:hypothetical protein
MAEGGRPAVHPLSPLARPVEAVKRLVYRIGRRPSWELLGISEATLDRRLVDGEWLYVDVLRLKLREQDEYRARELHAVETASLYGGPVGEPVAVLSRLSESISDGAQIIGGANAILRDGKLDASDRAEAERMRATLKAQIAHATQLEADLGAWLDRTT